MGFDTSQVQVTLGLRYANIRKIGSGGMASVFSAYDAVLTRTVAVKLLEDNQNASEMAVRFQREAKLASKLKHPNIVGVLDFGVGENGTLYLIMDLVEGSSLETYLSESETMDSDLAIPMFIQVCEALEHSHNQGIVHRDLKPSNIMLVTDEDRHRNVRLVDFGIAKVLTGDQKLTTTGATLGTPLYSSPEQIQAEKIDSRSDIYSFGCVMLAVLTGSPPFRGETALATYEMHMNKPAPTLLERGYTGEYSEELNRIIAKSLSKDPENRYQSFSQVKSELMELLSEEAREIVYEVEKEYAKEKFVSRSFLSEHRWALALFALISISIGAWAIFKKEPEKVKDKPVRFSYVGVQEPDWKFYPKTKNGITTWTNIDCRMSDKHFKQLVGKNVRSVKLYAMRLNGSGLKYLKDEPVEILSVAESKIVDEHLHYIGDLKNLKRLDLSYTWITDKGVKTISELPGLHNLGLAGCTKLTTKSVDEVIRFAPNIKELNISLTPVGKGGFEKLAKLDSLLRLDISLSELDDDSIEPIFKLKQLVQLKISKNKDLTDTTLEKLSLLPYLNSLSIDSCPGFSEDAIAKFKRRKPDCKLVMKAKKRKEPVLIWQTHGG